MKLNKALFGLISISAIPLTSISCEVSISNQADVDKANEEQLKINIQAHNGNEHVLIGWNPTNDFKVRDEYVDSILASVGLEKNSDDSNYGYKVISKNVIYPTNSTGGSFDAYIIATYNGDANEATLEPVPRKVYFVSVPGAMQEQDVLSATKSIKGNNYPQTGMVTLNSVYSYDDSHISEVSTPQIFNERILSNYGIDVSEENNDINTYPSFLNTFKTSLKYTLIITNDTGSVLTIFVSKEGTRVIGEIQYKINFKPV